MKQRAIIFTSMLMLCYALPASGREHISINQGWYFQRNEVDGADKTSFDDSRWEQTNLPHTWVTWNDINKGDYYKGPTWYRHELTIDKAHIGKRLFLRFEGALTKAKVYLNGELIGSHKGGFSAFCFEISNRVKAGKNSLAVRVDNSPFDDVPPAEERLFGRHGGIYRPAWLIVTEPICITPLDFASPGVYIKQKKVSEKKASLEILTKLSNGTDEDCKVAVETTIFSHDGDVVKTESDNIKLRADRTTPITQKFTIKKPHLWNGRNDPYLYNTVVTVKKDDNVLDQITQPLGLRYFRVDADEGFFLNGEYMDLYGVNRHQEWEEEGYALTDEHHKKDIELIVDVGANALRFSHYQHADTMYSLCDQYGIVAWAEIPLVSGFPETPEYLSAAKDMLTELIRQNYNHPSICFWGIFNECKITPDALKQLHKLAKKEDPTRLTTAASNAKLAEKHKITDLICWNQYPLWYGKRNKIESWADELHEDEPKLRIGVSEYGAGGCVEQQQQNPKRPDPGKGRFFPEQYQSYVHEEVWPMLKARPHLWCKFIWTMFDFSWPGVTRGVRANLNNKGLVTFDRKTKKDAFFYYKANWSHEPVLHITSKRHTVRTNALTEVKIYSNCSNAVLNINGKDHGTTKGSNCVFKWQNIKLQPGENTIKVTAQRNGQKLNDSCKWKYDKQTLLPRY